MVWSLLKDFFMKGHIFLFLNLKPNGVWVRNGVWVGGGARNVVGTRKGWLRGACYDLNVGFIIFDVRLSVDSKDIIAQGLRVGGAASLLSPVPVSDKPRTPS